MLGGLYMANSLPQSYNQYFSDNPLFNEALHQNNGKDLEADTVISITPTSGKLQAKEVIFVCIPDLRYAKDEKQIKHTLVKFYERIFKAFNESKFQDTKTIAVPEIRLDLPGYNYYGKSQEEVRTTWDNWHKMCASVAVETAYKFIKDNPDKKVRFLDTNPWLDNFYQEKIKELMNFEEQNTELKTKDEQSDQKVKVAQKVPNILNRMEISKASAEKQKVDSIVCSVMKNFSVVGNESGQIYNATTRLPREELDEEQDVVKSIIRKWWKEDYKDIREGRREGPISENYELRSLDGSAPPKPVKPEKDVKDLKE